MIVSRFDTGVLQKGTGYCRQTKVDRRDNTHSTPLRMAKGTVSLAVVDRGTSPSIPFVIHSFPIVYTTISQWGAGFLLFSEDGKEWVADVYPAESGSIIGIMRI
ncbi:hypothetical protein VTH8203_03304 [Vibrio thalassae]|uniref:Uncharacterized protein n=1 Tax=Vibrio thalassae TaxID=1243014 RepID=A0A240EM12_9VIBR|nr:hypothetical protein VTH8203_03304 [Vibrio thalassae]